MAYSKQTFTLGQVLTAAEMNNVEDNIADHTHGVDSVSNGSGICVIALNDSTDSNGTGDGTNVTVDLNNETIADLNSNFASDTFTAPVTGYYLFIGLVSIGTTTAATSNNLKLVTSNRNWNLPLADPDDVSGTLNFGHVHLVADMEASDTAYLQFTASGAGGKDSDIFGVNGSEPRTYLAVVLLA